MLTKVWFENDGWCYGEFEVLSEDGLDDEAIQRIRRVKGLLKNGCKIGISCVILGYWENSSGSDYLKRMVTLKGADLTMNPSWKSAGIVSIDGSENEKTFSEFDIEYDPEAYKDTKIKVKQFSNFDSGDLLRSSKINGKFTQLKVKSFSFNSEIIIPIEEEVALEEPIQKDFSVVALRDRVREAKYSVRQRFRVLVLSYRQLIKQQGGVEKIDPETLKIMKSLFTTDILDIMKTITPEIMAGKNPGTLLGASSLGKGVRQSVQKMFLPYKMAMSEVTKTGAISKARYQKIQQAYSDFTNAMIEEVFAPKTTIGGAKSESTEEEIKEEK